MYGSDIKGQNLQQMAKPDSNILREMEVFEKDMVILRDSIGQLISRVEPLCRPAQPATPTGQGAGNAPVVSGFAARLEGFRSGLANIQFMVTDAHNRLDL